MPRVSASAASEQSEVIFRNRGAEPMNPNLGLVCSAPHGLTEWASNAPPETEDPDEDDEDEDEEEDDEEVDEDDEDDEDEDEEDEDDDVEDAP